MCQGTYREQGGQRAPPCTHEVLAFTFRLLALLLPVLSPEDWLGCASIQGSAPGLLRANPPFLG